MTGFPTRPAQVRRLFNAGVTAEGAGSYPTRFRPHEVVDLAEAGVSPETAAAYPAHVPGYTIAKLAQGAVAPDHVPPAPELRHTSAGTAQRTPFADWQSSERG